MTQDAHSAFRQERNARIAGYAQIKDWAKASYDWMLKALEHKYTYNFEYLGRPVIQFPGDMIAVQELIWETKPDLVIETGVAHGGSLILSAAALAMVEYAEAFEKGESLNPRNPKRRVVGIDIDIRPHNRQAIETHAMSSRISLIEGSSLSDGVMDQVRAHVAGASRVMVFLDSNHTHDHVLKELELYAPLTSKGSYCVVFDTIVEDIPASFSADRPWKPGNNPKTALHAYLDTLKKQPQNGADGQPLQFEIDKQIEMKAMLTVAPDGYLKRV